MRDLPARDNQFHGRCGRGDRRGLRLRIEHLADVGGGRGLLLASIYRRTPKLQGVLFDLPGVVGRVPQDRFSGLEGRIAIEPGSFFERVPVGCDAYVMKHIIHDWSDEHCRMILKLIRERLPKDGRVLLCEMVVTDEPGPTPAKLLDIEMLVMTVAARSGRKRNSPSCSLRRACGSAASCPLVARFQ